MVLFLLLLISISTLANTPKLIEQPQDTKKPKLIEPSKARGQLLYENHCRVCHSSIVHIRKNRKAKKLINIYYWANRWSKVLKLKWSKAELDDVVKYLNNTYYRFEK